MRKSLIWMALIIAAGAAFFAQTPSRDSVAHDEIAVDFGLSPTFAVGRI